MEEKRNNRSVERRSKMRCASDQGSHSARPDFAFWPDGDVASAAADRRARGFDDPVPALSRYGDHPLDESVALAFCAGYQDR